MSRNNFSKRGIIGEENLFEKNKKSGNGFNLSCPRFVTKIKMYNS